ncbi:MAG: GNAT family N-acetyltransferase [Desulfobacterales bacterium]|nr:GNAT family N-acetyltransferase [Desulfobacterales bacterium]
MENIESEIGHGIRCAGPGDSHWVVEAHGRLYAREFGFDCTFEASIATKMDGFLNGARDFDTLWIYDVGGRPVGSLAVSSKGGQMAFLNFLLVEPEFRGMGIARKLLNHVLAHCRRHGFQTLGLETYSCLENARKFYAGAGFERVISNPGMEKFGHVFDQEFWEVSV